MTRPHMIGWSTLALTLGTAMIAGLAGCATTTAPALAAVQGGQDANQACAGVPAKERELGLASYRDAIAGTAPMHERVQLSKSVTVEQQVGVQIAVRAQPGLTAPWIERVATCHAALATSGQLESRDAKDDPLAVPGVSVTVAEAATGFVVSVRAPNANVAEDVNSRALAMTK